MNFEPGLQGNGNGGGRLPSSNRLGFGIVGYGYWGPNLARNVADSDDFRLLGM